MGMLSGDAALIVIDVQKGFDDVRWGPRNNPEAETRIAELLSAWRGSGLALFHIQHDSTAAEGAFRPGAPGHEHKAEVAPAPGEAVIRKSVNSAFIGTPLEAELRQRNISSLVVVGLTTNHCVSTTVRMAGNLGFQVFVVSDATATFDRPGLDGRNRSAAEVHDAALSDLRGEFAQVVDTAAVLAGLANLPARSAPTQSVDNVQTVPSPGRSVASGL